MHASMYASACVRACVCACARVCVCGGGGGGRGRVAVLFPSFVTAGPKVTTVSKVTTVCAPRCWPFPLRYAICHVPRPHSNGPTRRRPFPQDWQVNVISGQQGKSWTAGYITSVTEKRVQLEDLKLRLTGGTNKGVRFSRYPEDQLGTRRRVCVCVCVCVWCGGWVGACVCMCARACCCLSLFVLFLFFLFVSLKVTRACGISPMSAVC